MKRPPECFADSPEIAIITQNKSEILNDPKFIAGEKRGTERSSFVREFMLAHDEIVALSIYVKIWVTRKVNGLVVPDETGEAIRDPRYIIPEPDDSGNLPDNQQIEEALRSYQALYQADETRAQLALLRQVAIEYMEQLSDFDPHLTGPVLNGTAGRHAGITLQLFTDLQKDVEFLLIALNAPYQATEHRTADAHGRIYPRFIIDDPRASVEIIVYPAAELRSMKRLQADGNPRRVRLPQARTLV